MPNLPFSFSVCCAAMFFLYAQAWGKTQAEKPPHASQKHEELPVIIDAEHQILCDDLKRCCTATKDVRVKHGDLNLYADQLSSFFSKPLSIVNQIFAI